MLEGKLERTYSFGVQSGKIPVCNVRVFSLLEVIWVSTKYLTLSPDLLIPDKSWEIVGKWGLVHYLPNQ